MNGAYDELVAVYLSGPRNHVHADQTPSGCRQQKRNYFSTFKLHCDYLHSLPYLSNVEELLACEQQTHFRSSLLSDRKCVCCSQAKELPEVESRRNGKAKKSSLKGLQGILRSAQVESCCFA